MGPYIAAAQQNICGIVEALVAFEKCDVRFGLVAYRDHPPQAETFVTKKFDFTSSTSTMRRTVDTLKVRDIRFIVLPYGIGCCCVGFASKSVTINSGVKTMRG